MAHHLNFNENTGRYSFFSVKEKAWHGLGQIVDQYPTSAEAIKHAGLDYTVSKCPLFTHGTQAESQIKVPGHSATIRTDTNTLLGIVGKDYQLVQNSEAFGFFDAIVGGSDGILFETAGALGQGERIFITAKLPGYIRVGKGDDVSEKYIFLTTSHDGSGSITAAFTPIRIVCQNTLNASLRNMSHAVRIKHTARATDRLQQAHKVMGLANEFTTELEGIFNQWSKIRVSDKELRKLLQLSFSPNKQTSDLIRQGKEDQTSTVFKNTVEDAFSYAMLSDTQQLETTRGTLFGAYNAVTGYYQNVRNYKNDQAKLQSIVLGGTAQMKGQRAFDFCTAFAKNGQAVFGLN